jgi:prevent-host-death family protein
MAVVNIHEAKTHFSRLVERAEAGEEIVIGRSGVPVARLVPFRVRKGPRKLGGWRGKVWIGPDFDELPEDLAASFRGDRP